MKLIKPHVEMWHQQSGLQGIYDIIEAAGKVTHEAKPKGGETAKAFVDRLIANKHTAMLEFGAVYLTGPVQAMSKYMDSPYARVVIRNQGRRNEQMCVSTNLRVLQEHDWMDDLQYLCEPEILFHSKRYTFKFYTDRAISHEAVRHRAMSFAQESQRFCNYSSDKFGTQITFVIPSWSNLNEGDYANIGRVPYISNEDKMLVESLLNAERTYVDLINKGLTPQEARAILPNATKTEIVISGFGSDWKHFLDLRYSGTTGAPHPDMYNVAKLVHELFEAEGITL